LFGGKLDQFCLTGLQYLLQNISIDAHKGGKGGNGVGGGGGGDKNVPYLPQQFLQNILIKMQ